MNHNSISLGTTASRISFLAFLGALLGVVGGIAAFIVIHLVGLISNLALLHKVGFNLPNLDNYHPTIFLIPTAMLGGLIAAILAIWAPVIKGHGIPESIEAILLRQSKIPPKAALAKPISSAIVMGTGGPFGAEGPIIVTGGSIGSLLGQLLSVSPIERRILLATGAAAGMAGVFNTPIAAIIIAFELLLFERSLRSIVPLVLATSIASEIHVILIGPNPIFAMVQHLTISPFQFLFFIILGISVGFLALILNKGLFLVEKIFSLLPVSEFWHPVIGAMGFGIVGMIVPGTLSVGYWAISDTINGKFLLTTAAILFVGKMISWWIALGSNTSGGTLAPMFLIGSTMGYVLGVIIDKMFPFIHLPPTAFALAAMGATFGVGTRALLTGVVFSLEVTGAFGLALPVLITTVIAELVVERFLQERIMTDKLFKRGYRVNFDTEIDPFKKYIVSQVMEPAQGPLPLGPSIDPLSFLSEAVIFFSKSNMEKLPVVKEDTLVGWLSKGVLVDVIREKEKEDCIQIGIFSQWKTNRSLKKI